MPRRELNEAARALASHHAAPMVVGEPMIAEGFDEAIARSAETFKHDMNVATDDATREVSDGSKETETAATS